MRTNSDGRIDKLELLIRRLIEKIDQALRRIGVLEDNARAAQGGAYSSGGGGAGGRKACKATTAITARSGTTPGSGTVQPVQDVSGTLTDDGSTLTVGNLGAAISSGKYCMFWTDDYGSRWVEPEEC